MATPTHADHTEGYTLFNRGLFLHYFDGFSYRARTDARNFCALVKFSPIRTPDTGPTVTIARLPPTTDNSVRIDRDNEIGEGVIIISPKHQADRLQFLLLKVEEKLATKFKLTNFEQYDKDHIGLIVSAHEDRRIASYILREFFNDKANTDVITSAITLADYYGHNQHESNMRNILVHARVRYVVKELRASIPDLQAIRISRNALRIKTDLSDHLLRTYLAEWNREQKGSALGQGVGRKVRYEPQFYAFIRDDNRITQWLAKPTPPPALARDYVNQPLFPLDESFILAGMTPDTSEKFLVEVFRAWGLMPRESLTAAWVFDENNQSAIRLRIRPSRFKTKLNGKGPLLNHRMVNGQPYTLLEDYGRFNNRAIQFDSCLEALTCEDQMTALNDLLNEIIPGEPKELDQDSWARAQKITNSLNDKLKMQGMKAAFGELGLEEENIGLDDGNLWEQDKEGRKTEQEEEVRVAEHITAQKEEEEKLAVKKKWRRRKREKDTRRRRK